MIRLFVLVLILVNSLFGCKMPMPPDDPCPPDCPEDTIKYPLDVVWETYFYKDSSDILSCSLPASYKDNIIFAGVNFTGDDYYHSWMFNKTTGKLIAKFDYGLNPPENLVVMNDWLIASALDGIYIYDLNTFERILHLDETFERRFDTLGNDIYFVQFYGEVPFVDSSSVIRMTIPTLEIKKIFTITKKKYGGYSSLNPPTVEALEGDTIIYCQADTDFPYPLFAYSVNKKDFVWVNRDIMSAGDAYFNGPLYDDKHIYTVHNHIARAYDKFTGKSVWQTPLEGFYRPVKPLLLDGNLYMKANNYHLYCLNAKSGVILWHNNRAGNMHANMLGYDDINFYYSDEAHFYVVRRYSGKVIFKEKGPYQKIDLDNLKESEREFSKWVAAIPIIDREKRVIYLHDGKRMFCFKMKDDW